MDLNSNAVVLLLLEFYKQKSSMELHINSAERFWLKQELRGLVPHLCKLSLNTGLKEHI